MKNEIKGTENLFSNQQPEGLTTTKRKVGADVILLIFLCLLVLLTLTTLTFLKFGSEQVLTGEQAFAEEAESGERLMNVEIGTIDSKSAVMVYDQEGNYVEMNKEDVWDGGKTFDAFDYCVSLDYNEETNILDIDYYAHDDEGQILLDALGDPIIAHYSEYWPSGSFVGTYIDMDEALGLTGAETLDEVAEKYSEYAENAAYADNSTSYSPSATSQFGQNSSYQAGSTISASNSSSGGNGSGCSCGTCCFVTVGGNQWTRWWNASTIQGMATYSPSGGGSGHAGTWSRCGWMGGASYGESNSGSSGGWYGRSGSTMRYYVCVYARSNSTGSCSGSSVQAYANNCTFYVRHTNGDGLTVSLNKSTTWKPYRAANEITFTATASTDYIRYCKMKYSTSSSGDAWTWSNSTSSSETYNWFVATATKKNQGACYSNVYYYADDYAGHSRAATVYGKDLYIDGYRPDIDTSKFWISTSNSNSSKGSGSDVQPSGSNQRCSTQFNVASKTTALYMFVGVQDVVAWSNRSGASGVSRVYAYNNQNGYTTSNFTRGSNYSGSYYYYSTSIQAQYAVGYWTIYAIDGAGNQNTMGYWCSSVDCNPAVYNSDFSVNMSMTKSNAGSYWTVDSSVEGSWSSAPLYCTMSFKDDIGSIMVNNSNTTYKNNLANVYQNNGIASAEITFYCGSSTYKLSSGAASGGNVNVSNYIGLSNKNRGANGGAGAQYQTCTLYFYLPFSMNNIWTSSAKSAYGFSVTVKDHAGHSTTTTVNNQSYKIDNVAPSVTGVSVSVGSTAAAGSVTRTAAGKATGYVKDNVTVKVTAQDYANTSSTTSGFANCNNGSGVKTIYLYNVNPQSNRSAAPFQTVNVGSVNSTTQVTATFTITTDSYNIAGSTSAEPTLYAVAVDWAGNRSDAYNGYNGNSSYTKNTSQNNANYKSIQAPSAGAAYTWANYYKTPNTVSTCKVYRDTYQPVMRVYTSSSYAADSLIASTDNAASTSRLVSSNGASTATSTSYVFNWENATSRVLYVRVWCGSSGGGFTWSNKGSNDSINRTLENSVYPVRDYVSSGRTYSGNPAYSTYDFTITVQTEQERTHSLVFAGGSGKNTATVNITTRLDRTAPTITLRGFSNYYQDNSSYYTQNVSNLKTEAWLATNWVSTKYYAIFQVQDTMSGLSYANDTGTHNKTYGKNGTTLSQATSSSYTFTFNYSNGTRSYTKTLASSKLSMGVNGYGYVAVELFNIDVLADMKARENSSFSFKNGNSYDIAIDTFLQYTFEVKDFVGNKKTYASTSCLDPVATKNKAGQLTQVTSATTNLAYAADPFTMQANISLKTVPGQYLSGKSASQFTRGSTDYNNVKDHWRGYDGKSWTNEYVLVNIEITPSLSRSRSMVGSREYGSSGTFVYNASNCIPQVAEPDVVTEHWIYFAPSTRKFDIVIKCVNQADVGNTFQYQQTSNGLQQICLMQDNSAPTPIAAFFSQNPNIQSLSSNDILMYFDYTNGSFVKNEAKSHVSSDLISQDSSKNIIYFNRDNVYLYLLITDYDKSTGLDGSGITVEGMDSADQKKSKIDVLTSIRTSNSTESVTNFTYMCKFDATSGDPGTKGLYRSGKAATTPPPSFGYVNVNDSQKYCIRLKDYLGNDTYNTYNDKIGFATSNNGTVKMIPVIDKVTPIVVLTGTASVSYVSLNNDGTPERNSGSYVYKDKYSSGYYYNGSKIVETVSNDDSKSPTRLLGTKRALKTVNGVPVTDGSGNPVYDSEKYADGKTKFYAVQSADGSITITLAAQYGMSGYKLYLRRRELDSPIVNDEDTLDIETAGSRLPSGYNFAQHGWGNYENGVWVSSGAPFRTITSGTGLDSSVSLKISGGVTMSNRFDVLIVGGTGLYYLFELGDIFIDSTAPEYLSDMTFYTVYKGQNTEPDVDIVYNDLTNRIWSNTVDDEYTNSKVYGYVSLYDLSGIMSVWTSNNATLQKVEVFVPTLVIDGNAADILWIKDVYGDFAANKVVLEKETVQEGALTKQYYKVKIKKNSGDTAFVKTATAKINYIDGSHTVELTTRKVTYYRYLFTGGEFPIYAQDTLQNKASSSYFIVKPNIDTTDTLVTGIKMEHNKEKGDYVEAGALDEIGNAGKVELVKYNSGTPSRSDVKVSVSVTYGASGIGSFTVRRRNAVTGATINTYEIKVPMLTKSGDYVKMKYYSGGKMTEVTLTSVRNVSKKYGDSTAEAYNTVKVVKSGSNYYWNVNDTLTSYKVDATYYSGLINFHNDIEELKIDVIIGSGRYAVLSYAVKDSACRDVFDFSFKNGVKNPISYTRETQGSTRTYPYVSNANGESQGIYIDKIAPVIDTTSGNFSEFSDPVSVAKLLKVGISDNYELRVNGDFDKLKDITFTDVRNGVDYFMASILAEKKLVNNQNVNETDGLFRPVDVRNNKIVDFVYCDSDEYRITVYDAAGNRTQVTLNVNIDQVTPEITQLKYFTGTGTPTLSNLPVGNDWNSYAPGAGWRAYVPGEWTGESVLIYGSATYGSSGYVLQHYNFNLRQWENLSTGNNASTEYKLVTSDDNGKLTFALWLTRDDVSGKIMAMYEDYTFRIISKAQENDLKSSGLITTNDLNSQYQIARETFNKLANGDVGTTAANNVKYNGNNLAGTETYYLYEIVGAPMSIAASKVVRVRIDKVRPDIDVDVITSMDGKTGYNGGIAPSDANKWVFHDKYVADAVTVNVTSTQSYVRYIRTLNSNNEELDLSYASGTEYYYTTADVNKSDKAKWTCIKVNNGIYYVYSYVSGDGYTKLESVVDSSVMTPEKNDTTNEYHAENGLFKYLIGTSQQNTTFKFYLRSGAGLESDTFVVSGVKIDINQPNISVSAKDSYLDFDNGVAITAADYDNENNEDYSITDSAKWTKKNSVLFKIELSNIGYSGAELKVGGNVITVTYEQFLELKAAANSSYAVFYYAFSGNGDRTVDMHVREISERYDTVSPAGVKRRIETASGRIKIDNTTPYLIVKSISGDRAGNWMYAGSNDKWYIANFKIALQAGIIEKTKSGSGFVYQLNDNATPYSGYKIMYTLVSYVDKSGEQTTLEERNLTWTEVRTSAALQSEKPVNGEILSLNGFHKNSVYRFKIVSTSGMEYVIGDALYNNDKNPRAITSVKKGSETIALSENVSEMHTVLSGKKGHKLDATDDGMFVYAFNIDTNDYTFDYLAQIYTGSEYGYNTNTADIISGKTNYKGNWADANGGTFTAIDSNVNAKYKHGDIIRVSYEAKTATTTAAIGDNFDFTYYHMFTEIRQVETNNGTSNVVGAPEVVTNDGTAVKEGNGYFTFVFGEYDVEIVSDFGAELPVYYGDTTFFIQHNDNTDTVTVGNVAYNWRKNGRVESVSPALGYGYYVLELNGLGQKVFTKNAPVAIKTNNDKYYGIGAYYVVPRIDLYQLHTAYSVGDSVSGEYFVYDEATKAYVRTTDTSFKRGVKYYSRNQEIGNFRVAIHDGAEEERQEFVVKYFDETVDGDRYTVEDKVDFGYIDHDYFDYDPATDVVTKRSYLRDTLANGYVLTSDLTLNIGNTLGGVFEASFDGNGKTVTLDFNSLDNNTLTTSYGLFEKFGGTLYSMNLVLKNKMTVSLRGGEEIEVGLLAKEITGGKLYNVSVTADLAVTQADSRTATSYIGGVAAKASNVIMGTTAYAVYTDIRVTNNGSPLKNVYLGGMFGYTDSVNFANAIAFGDVTVYNADAATTKIGMVTPAGSINDHSGLYYLADNTFFNDGMISAPGIGFANQGTALLYDSFVVLDNESGVSNPKGNVQIVDKKIRRRILDRLYVDFGMDASEGDAYADGTGTERDPLKIGTIAQLATIDSYVNLHYQLTRDIDVSDFMPIATHKSFNGSLDGSNIVSTYYALTGFGKATASYADRYFGFFGQLRGTVSNIVFSDIAVGLTYTGTGTLNAGIVAGVAYDTANINNVILVGITDIKAQGQAAVYAGGLIGSGDGCSIYDIMNINNLSVTAAEMKVGGIVGSADDVFVASNRGRVFSLGRVETKALGESARVEAGAMVGEGDVHFNMLNKSVYGLLNNTYVMGVVVPDQAIGRGNVDGQYEMVDFENENMRLASFVNNLSPFTLLFSDDNDWYPLSGKGLKSDPFKINNESDFAKINFALYAAYQIMNDITFTSYETIGDGLNFTGSIDGSGSSDNISAEVSNIVSLKNVTKPLIYNVMGVVQNISINVNYNRVIESGETLYFGVVAVKLTEGGNVKNVTIDGTVNIRGVDSSTTAYVSGFVAIISGGKIGDSEYSDPTKVRNNISALNIRISDVGTVYVGGYAASVERGGAEFSFGISSGKITLEDCGTVIAGYLVGQSYGECAWDLPLSSDYFYDFEYIINENGVRIVQSNPGGKPEEDDENKEDKLIGRKN